MINILNFEQFSFYAANKTQPLFIIFERIPWNAEMNFPKQGWDRQAHKQSLHQG